MSLFRAVAAALVGQDVGEQSAVAELTTPEQIVTELEAAGWASDAIAEHRAQTLAAGERWPHPIRPEHRGEVGAAQASATLAAVRKLLAVDGAPRVRASGLSLDQRDRQLIADLPPHHVQR